MYVVWGHHNHYHRQSSPQHRRSPPPITTIATNNQHTTISPITINPTSNHHHHQHQSALSLLPTIIRYVGKTIKSKLKTILITEGVNNISMSDRWIPTGGVGVDSWSFFQSERKMERQGWWWKSNSEMWESSCLRSEGGSQHRRWRWIDF